MHETISGLIHYDGLEHCMNIWSKQTFILDVALDGDALTIRWMLTPWLKVTMP